MASGEKLLTADEEIALGRRVQAGDLAARNELVERNRAFVLLRTRYYARVSRCRDEDLIQIGMVGLIEAANCYDPDRFPGVRFLTYAAHHVHKQMVAYLYSRPLVRVTHAMRNPAILGDARPRTSKRRQEIRDWSLIATYRAKRGASSLDQLMTDESSGLMDRFVDQTQLPPDTRSDSLDQLEQLRTAMAALTDLELEILRRKFGLDGAPKQQRKVIIRDLKISHEWYRKIQKKALGKLKRELTAASA